MLATGLLANQSTQTLYTMHEQDLCTMYVEKQNVPMPQVHSFMGA